MNRVICEARRDLDQCSATNLLGTPMCRDAMLGVAGRNFIKKYEHYSSLTQALDKLALCVYVDFCGIRIEVLTTTR